MMPLVLLAEMREAKYVRTQTHPDLPLLILNYTERAQYDSVWNAVTLQCRGLIVDADSFEVVARPFPKFFNYGQPGAPELDLHARVTVTDKLDGSLGILYPVGDGDLAVATRGSFLSDQAVHATAVYRECYAGWWEPQAGITYLAEIVYPENRIVCDYGALDDLILLCALDTETGIPVPVPDWPGPRAAEFPYATLAEALEAPARDGAEGFVVYFPDVNERVKLKQDDYMALHRILTGTNARHVWEVAAVAACRTLVTDEKHWGSFLGIDPARAAQASELGDDWLEGVPDEFHAWVNDVIVTAVDTVRALCDDANRLVEECAAITDRRARYEHVSASGHVAQREILRLADGKTEEAGRLLLRCWRAAEPAPTAPFARGEDVA